MYFRADGGPAAFGRRAYDGGGAESQLSGAATGPACLYCGFPFVSSAMKSKSAAWAILVVALVALPPPASARQPERLQRPAPSALNEEGKLVVAEGATFGQLLVDRYAAFGRQTAAPDAAPETVQAWTTLMCSGSATRDVAAYAIGRALKGLKKDVRARLKARDPASMTFLAAATIGTLDGVSTEAILADEAIGPGAYHDAIVGMRTAIEACAFFGQKP
jgi:hypothetical protein